MSYYKLKEFTPIDDNTLVDLFESSKTIKRGAISIWGDTIGKPGDTIYHLKSIVKKDKEIVFNFGSSEIRIINPNNIYVNEKVIGFDKSEKIIWKEFDYNLVLEYSYLGRKLNTNSIKGEHNFKSNMNEYAFMLYTW